MTDIEVFADINGVIDTTSYKEVKDGQVLTVGGVAVAKVIDNRSQTITIKPVVLAAERIKLEVDTVICECGEEFKDSDLADLVDDLLKELKDFRLKKELSG